MVRSQKVSKKYIPISTVVASFAGMLMAVPLAYAVGSPANIAAAGQNQQAVSQVSQADFAKFAYAFNQGYEARTASATTSSTATPTCSDASVVVPGVGAAAASSDGGGSAQSMTVSAPLGRGSGGMGSVYVPKSAPKMSPQDTTRWASMVNSFNSYAVYNSSTVMNTNSNNTLGSNNSTSTSIAVKDSKNVMVGVSNDPSVSQMNASNSFNKDSYNTKTDTTIVNDSFNKPVTIDSNNATATTNTTNVAKDSFNKTNVTNTTDSNNKTDTTNTMSIDVTKTENKTIDSNNTTTTDTKNTTNTNVNTEVTVPQEDKNNNHAL